VSELNASPDEPGATTPLPLSVVVPVRNGESLIEGCLESITRSNVAEIIVVDGCSTDRTVEIARRYTDHILSDDGRGVAFARMLGAQAATSLWVATVDVDVVLPPGSLADLFGEFIDDGYTALQAGLASVAGPGYWGQALANHHRTGRSKNWFGLVATIFEREAFIRYGMDANFISGEDIDLRWRLRDGGEKIGVSKSTFVTHIFDDTYRFARAQWDDDGRGLARMVTKHGARGLLLLVLPVAAALRGIAISLAHLQPKWIRYYLYYGYYNYVSLFDEIRHGRDDDLLFRSHTDDAVA